jgi:hypothetical protein
VLVAGSAPPARLFRPVWNGKQFSAVAQTMNRQSYAFEFTSSLSPGAWTAISTNSGNGALRILTDPAAGGTQRLYRTRQW